MARLHFCRIAIPLLSLFLCQSIVTKVLRVAINLFTETNKMKKTLSILYVVMLIASMLLSACGDGEASAPTAAAEQPQNSGSGAQPAADTIVGTWQDSSGIYTYTEDGKLLINNEDNGTTYTYQDNVLTEFYPDGTSRAFNLQFEANGVTQTEEGGESFFLESVGSETASAEVTTGEVMVDTGFRPEVDGFSIPNYGGSAEFQITDLTSYEMRRLFGDGVCAAQPEDDGSCALTPPASQWMEQTNSAMGGGHCEGFAALSQVIYGGKVDPNYFGAARTIDLQIPDNEILQREIAYWWATQMFLNPNDEYLTAQDALDALNTKYTNDAKSLIRIAICKAPEDGGGDCHAITAYGVQDQGDGIYWIMVYDNNHPGAERHITVDTNTNAWEYEASINPSVDPFTYRGNLENQNSIRLAREEMRADQPYFPCEFCNGTGSAGKGGSKLAIATQEFNQIFTEGYVNVELEDDNGRKIGYDENGKFVNEITEAQIQEISSGGTLSEVPPIINMPVGMNFTAYIWGDDRAAEIPASLVMIGKGYYIGIDGLAMVDGQEDSLSVDGTGDFLNYFTESAESPDIIVGIEKPAADFELWLKAVQLSAGTDISVLFDQKEDTFAFMTTSDGPAQFAISITRIDVNGEEETFDTGDTPLDIDPDKLMYFYFGEWEGQGSNLEIGYDENGNGEIEDDEIINMADAE